MKRRPGPVTRTKVVVLDGERRSPREDRLATEEPLEIRVSAPRLPVQRVAVTMRTPGHDFELAAGWTVHEGITRRGDIVAVRYCTEKELREEQIFNVVTVELCTPPLSLPAARMVSSACGVCGADSVREVPMAPSRGLVYSPAVLRALPRRLEDAQPGFERTGGLHAAGLFQRDGQRSVVREDVGRHNAVDKVLGSCYLGGVEVPPVLVLSGRVAFELVHKAVAAGIDAVVAVGAPTSLAVDLAREAGLVVVGFTRSERCVVYAGSDRVLPAE